MEKPKPSKTNLSYVTKRLSQPTQTRDDLTLIKKTLSHLQDGLIKAKKNLEAAEEELKKCSAEQSKRVLEASLEGSLDAAKRNPGNSPPVFDAIELGHISLVTARTARDAAKEIVADLERQIAELKS